MKRFNKRAIDPLYVFGSDDRWAFRDSSWPWGLVGKVYTSSGWTGSAALIGDRLIATAGHVVPWHDNPWWMRFVPAFYDGVSLHGIGVESYISDAKGYDVDGSVTGYDWAVCRLYEPLGSYLGYFGYNGYSDDWENDPYWSIIGYPSAIAGAQRPSFQGSITSDDTDGDSNGGLEIETKADLTPGNSGGPMFGWWDDDPRLIGVVSGQEEEWSPGFWPWEWADTELTNVIAGGSGFTNMMAWGRTNWPL
ncbi:MAG: trypsin-like serine protease [Bacteroidetes bacterium]|nr:trypsin-like serine protease [Bacteroidota bacterium]